MQTSYTINMGRYIAGMILDIKPIVVNSMIADVAISFGYGVVNGAKVPGGSYASGVIPGKVSGGFAPASCKLPTAGGQVFAGIALQQHTEQAYPFTASSAGYAINDLVNVGRRGVFIAVVTAGTTIVAGETAYLVNNTGLWINSSGSSAIVTGGIFTESVAADGSNTTLAPVELNLP